MRPERESPRGKIMKPATHEEGPTVVVKEATKEGIGHVAARMVGEALGRRIEGFPLLGVKTNVCQEAHRSNTT